MFQEISLIYILICAAINEADTKSTWMEAMTTCRQQCSTIESDTTILKQHYLKVNEKFWLPTAVYKTTWTEQLGCYPFIANTGRIHCNVTLGWCQQLCLNNNITYFSYKDSKCMCLPQFENTMSPAQRSGTCNYIIYHSIHNLKYTGSGDCIETTCRNTGERHYVKGQFIATDCQENYNINAICSNGKYLRNYISQIQAMTTCLENHSYLPGHVDQSCTTIAANTGQGRETSMMWSSIFKTTFKNTYTIADKLIDSPLTCKSGRFSDKTNGGQIIEENTDCNADLSFICQGTENKTFVTTECETSEANNDPDSSLQTVAIAAGVTVGLILILVILLITIVISRKRNCGPFKHNSDMKNERAKNNNINQPNYRPSRHHGDIINMSTELQHIRGTINNDEYAVINRNTLQSQHHPPTNTVINREKVYITPTPEYDRLNHSDTNTLQLNNGVYDRNTQTYTGYNTAMFNVRQPNTVAEGGYDHVSMGGYHQDNSEYA